MPMTSFTLAGPIGADAHPVSIHCSVDAAQPTSLRVEGDELSQQQSKEIATRVRSAISATDLCPWPAGRVTIVVESKGAKLQTPALDLAIALAISGIDLEGLLVAGELGLDGSVRPVRGALQAVFLARTLGLRGVLVPTQNAREALEASDDEVAVHAIGHLSEISPALSEPAERSRRTASAREMLDFSDVRGQPEAVAAMERSVQSRAGLLLSGPPGTGKTMIARRIPSVLPRMRRDEQLEVTRIYSAVGLVAEGLVTERPFRAPHHTISIAALAGGDTSRRPGEVHLATRGVLFLDEIQEFSRASIEALTLALGAMSPASRPLVVASAIPCPCGYRDSTVRSCRCPDAVVARHAARVEWAAKELGLTITATVRALTIEDLRGAVGESSTAIAARVSAAATSPDQTQAEA